MGYRNLEELCHKLESVMGRVRDGKLEVTSEIVDVMLNAVDAIEEMIDRIEEGGRDDVDIEEILTALQSFMGAKEKKTGKVEEKSFNGANFKVEVYLSNDCVMKSVRAALVVEALSEVAEVVGTIPVEEDMESETFDGQFTVFLKAQDEKIIDETNGQDC